MKQLKDYLHLYLGCEMQTEDGVSTLESISTDGLVGDENRDESGEGWYHIDDIKPILRKLSDMTEQEAEFLYYNTRQDEILFNYPLPSSIRLKMSANHLATTYLLSKHFDLFSLIESGLAIDATKHKT